MGWAEAPRPALWRWLPARAGRGRLRPASPGQDDAPGSRPLAQGDPAPDPGPRSALVCLEAALLQALAQRTLAHRPLAILVAPGAIDDINLANERLALRGQHATLLEEVADDIHFGAVSS